MKILIDNPIHSAALLRFMCIFALLLFFAAVVIAALLMRQKRYKLLWLVLPILCLSYFMEQCFYIAIRGYTHTQGAAAILSGFGSLPEWLLLSVCFASAAVEILLMRNIHLCENNRITPTSLNEAIDSLPCGILCYVPGVQVLLVNRVMQDFCRKTTGTELVDGSAFRTLLLEGELLPGCKRVFVGGDPVIVLPDGTARKISEGELPYEKNMVHRILAANITEAYRKTQELTQMQEKVAKLGKRLQKVNREIVALTTQREILNAKVKIHDELGSNLLAIKRYLVNGGTEEEKTALMENLRLSVSFLKNSGHSHVQDEYELLISMAARLGLKIIVTGELPQTEPHKPIIATAIHECFTNTLRHAHGDELHIELSEDGETIMAVFTNNGDPPEGGIIEKGGLKSLRELTEQAGGSMTIQTKPVFMISIQLPKEDAYDI